MEIKRKTGTKEKLHPLGSSHSPSIILNQTQSSWCIGLSHSFRMYFYFFEIFHLTQKMEEIYIKTFSFDQTNHRLILK